MNGRAAVWLVNEKDEEIIQLTVNVPEAMLMTDFDDNPKIRSHSSWLNHVDFWKYDELYEELVKQNVIENETIGMIKQGYQVYSGIIFKEESLNQMEVLGN